MSSVLFAWVGDADLDAAIPGNTDPGPIASALRNRRFDYAHLLSNFDDPERNCRYEGWLRESRLGCPVSLEFCRLSSPTDYRAVYEAAVKAIDRVLAERDGETDLTFHLSPGTGTMGAVWIILASGRYRATLIQSARGHAPEDVEIPFMIYAEFVPELISRRDEELLDRAEGRSGGSVAFDSIIYRSRAMDEQVTLARRMAPRMVPVLIQGETGTGKELFARAIHSASVRSGRLVPVDCGAIPAELAESELFGHKKGSFTGAVTNKRGLFQEADGGTLFLDEVGELGPLVQAKLLRALQEKEILPVGETKWQKVDVRVVAATNRRLGREVAAGRFRPDLYHRLAVGLLEIPPLRERGGDLSLLVDHAVELVNRHELRARTISPAARRFLAERPWPGNVRELQATLVRASIWTQDDCIGVEHVRRAVLPALPDDDVDVLGRPLDGSFSIEEQLGAVARHYLERALRQAEGNKSKAARLLRLGSHQRLSSWLRKHNVAT